MNADDRDLALVRRGAVALAAWRGQRMATLTDAEISLVIDGVNATHPRAPSEMVALAQLREWARKVARAGYSQCGADEAGAHIDETGEWTPSTWDVDAVIDSCGPPPLTEEHAK